MDSAAIPASNSICRARIFPRDPEQFRQNAREQDHQQGPNGIGRSPELLGEECALHGAN